MISKNSGYAFKMLLLLFVVSCHYPRLRKQQLNDEQARQHSSYDDSTLNNNLLPVLMPFNRIISPAGTVVSWGIKNLEQHSLDVELIPGTDLLAVEERNGIVIIDPQKKRGNCQMEFQ